MISKFELSFLLVVLLNTTFFGSHAQSLDTLHYFVDELKVGYEIIEESSVDPKSRHVRVESVIDYQMKVRATSTFRAGPDKKITDFKVEGDYYPWLRENDAPDFPFSKLAYQFLADKGKGKWELRGTDSVNIAGGRVPLRRYGLTGKGWGTSLVWFDPNDRLMVCISPLAAFRLSCLHSSLGDKIAFFERRYAEDVYEKIFKDIEAKNKSFTQTLITNISLWNGVDDTVSMNVNILIEEGRIKEISNKKIKTKKNAFLINGTGKTLMPPLWDMHAHLKQVEWLPAYLARGIMKIRDLGNGVTSITSLDSLTHANPVFGIEIKKAGFIDGPSAVPRAKMIVHSAEDAKSIVDQYQRKGFDQIKVWNNITAKQFYAIAEESHKRGLKVGGHIPRDLDFWQAIKGGIDEINHVSFISSTLDLSDTTSTDSAIVSYLRRHNIVVDPTLVVTEIGWRNKATPLSDIESSARLIKGSIVNVWEAFGVSGEQIGTGEKFLKRSMLLVRNLYQGGVPVVAGSDQGIPGYSLIREIELYVEAGLTPLDAIKTATIIPDAVTKSASSAIRAGAPASFIILNGNPFQRIQDLRKCLYISSSGNLFFAKDFESRAGILKKDE
ncbi:MAG TPA: amidohydrolase family protein [Chryseosolibacter sp.]